MFGQHNLFIIFKKDLPKELRTVKSLDKFLDLELQKLWETIKDYTNNKYPSSKYKIYEKWRNGTGFKCSYLLFKVLNEDMEIEYKNKYSFTPEFVATILVRYSKLEQLKGGVIDDIKLNKIISKISLSFIIKDFDPEIKKKIIAIEKDIKKELNIKIFIDYIGKNNELINVLNTKGIEKGDEIATNIIKEVSEYKKVFDDLNISLTQ